MCLCLASLQQFVCVHASIPIIKNLIINSLFPDERLLNIIRQGLLSSARLKSGEGSTDDPESERVRWCLGAGNSSRFCPKKCI